MRCDKYEDCNYRESPEPQRCHLDIYPFCNFYDKVEKEKREEQEQFLKRIRESGI